MLKIGILTTAHIHTPNFVDRLKKMTSEVHVAGLWEPNKALADKYSKELNCKVVATAEEILNDSSIPAVVISGTTGEHDGLVVKAAKAGKNIFVEKPLATTPTEANRIFTAVKEAGVIFQTGHFMRSDANFQFLKKEIDAGNFGTITRARHVNCHHGALGGWFDKDYRWFFHKAEAGGGGFYDLGCHSVDILNFLLGPIEEATCVLGPKNVKYQNIDEYGEGLLKFKNGVIASVAAGWLDIGNPANFALYGTQGFAWINGNDLYYKSEKSKVAGADGAKPIDKSVIGEGMPHAFNLFFDVLLGKRDKSVLISVEDALNVCRTMDAMYQGDKLGSWVKV